MSEPSQNGAFICGLHQLALKGDLPLWKVVLPHLNMECVISHRRGASPLSFCAARCLSQLLKEVGGEGGTVRHQCQPEQGRLPRSRELLLAHDGESCMIIS